MVLGLRLPQLSGTLFNKAVPDGLLGPKKRAYAMSVVVGLPYSMHIALRSSVPRPWALLVTWLVFQLLHRQRHRGWRGQTRRRPFTWRIRTRHSCDHDSFTCVAGRNSMLSIRLLHKRHSASGLDEERRVWSERRAPERA